MMQFFMKRGVDILASMGDLPSVFVSAMLCESSSPIRTLLRAHPGLLQSDHVNEALARAMGHLNDSHLDILSIFTARATPL